MLHVAPVLTWQVPGVRQVLPQPPQLLASPAMCVSHPFELIPSQSAQPALQTIAHAPLVHDAVPLAVPHDVLQSPQRVVVLINASHPSEARPLQSAWMWSGHMTLEQTPLTQLSTAPPFVLHANLQPPQLVTLVLVFVSHPFDAVLSQSPHGFVQVPLTIEHA